MKKNTMQSCIPAQQTGRLRISSLCSFQQKSLMTSSPLWSVQVLSPYPGHFAQRLNLHRQTYCLNSGIFRKMSTVIQNYHLNSVQHDIRILVCLNVQQWLNGLVLNIFVQKLKVLCNTRLCHNTCKIKLKLTTYKFQLQIIIMK